MRLPKCMIWFPAEGWILAAVMFAVGFLIGWYASA